MKLIYLVRHAVNEYVATGKLAGRLPGVNLNEEGLRQATLVATRLAASTQRFVALYSSPLDRTLQTAAPISRALSLETHILPAVAELDFGEWQGQELKTLEQHELWRVVQYYPSGMTFPAGETMRAMQARAVDGIEALVSLLGANEAAIVVSHSDVMKAIIAHYAGMHLDHFQRVVISPASISVIGLTPERPLLLRLNDTAHLPEPAPPPAPAETVSATENGKNAHG
jgi:probable phosphomutase (TIGR03848 family)